MEKASKNQVVTIRGTVYTGSFLESVMCITLLAKNAKRKIAQLERYAHDFNLIRVEDALTGCAVAL